MIVGILLRSAPKAMAPVPRAVPEPTSARRTAVMPTVELPADARRALRSIAADMRNLPRDVIGDPAELLFWLRRMARRVEGVEAMRVPANPHRLITGNNGGAAPVLTGRKQANPGSGRASSVRDAAEAVFSAQGQPAARNPGLRTITSRKGQTVLVETRQLALMLEPPR